jgi:hypothetical protein
VDVHKATIVIAVLDANGKVVSQLIIETSTQAVRDFFQSLRGAVHVTLGEGNHAVWLYDVCRATGEVSGCLQSQTQSSAQAG